MYLAKIVHHDKAYFKNKENAVKYIISFIIDTLMGTKFNSTYIEIFNTILKEEYDLAISIYNNLPNVPFVYYKEIDFCNDEINLEIKLEQINDKLKEIVFK